MRILVATRGRVFRLDPGGGELRPVSGMKPDPTCLAADRTGLGWAWCGTEEGAYRSADDGTWERAKGLLDLPSSTEWSFPPRPEIHHVRWTGPHPRERGRLRVAVEAGALVTMQASDDGSLTWRDRVPGARTRPTRSRSIPSGPRGGRPAERDRRSRRPGGGRR